MAYFLSQTKNKSEQSELCSDVSSDYKKDIFSVSREKFELSHHTGHFKNGYLHLIFFLFEEFSQTVPLLPYLYT